MDGSAKVGRGKTGDEEIGAGVGGGRVVIFEPEGGFVETHSCFDLTERQTNNILQHMLKQDKVFSRNEIL